MSREKEIEKEEVMKEWLLHVFNIQTNKKHKNKQIYKWQTKNKLEKHTNNNKQTYKQKKPQKTNKINFCSYHLISYRYLLYIYVHIHQRQFLGRAKAPLILTETRTRVLLVRTTGVLPQSQWYNTHKGLKLLNALNMLNPAKKGMCFIKHI